MPSRFDGLLKGRGNKRRRHAELIDDHELVEWPEEVVPPPSPSEFKPRKKKWTARELLVALRVLADPFFFHPKWQRKAWRLVVCVMIALVFEGAGLMLFSEEQKHLMTALEKKHAAEFNEALVRVSVLIVMCVPTMGIHHYLKVCVEAEWRRALTERLGWMYLAGTPDNRGAFYALHLDADIDNPDQRILEDVHHLASNAVDLSVDLINHALQVVGFTIIIYSISPSACIAVTMFLGLATLIALRLFAPLLFKYMLLLTRQEASMRYCLIRVRENAESVAFFKGGPSEWTNFIKDFADLLVTFYRRLAVEACLESFKWSIQLATFFFPFILVAGPYMRGEVEFGVVSQMQFSFQMITIGMLIIMQRLYSFSELAVQVARVRELEEALLRAGAKPEQADFQQVGGAVLGNTEHGLGSGLAHGSIAMLDQTDPAGPVLALNGLTLTTPKKPGQVPQRLIEGLSCELKSGESLLIMGDSGIGKSSLLRGIAGLWSAGGGSVQRCSGDSIFFMPQCPYMCLGTLRSQLLYPSVDRNDVSDEELHVVLSQVNLGYLLKWHKLDDEKDWTTVLSMGEQQRLSFARALLQPNLRLALVDEGTSACDAANEKLLYRLLSTKLHSFVSIGHRAALEQFHTHVLWMRRDESIAADADNSPAVVDFYSMPEFQSRWRRDRASDGI